MKKAIFVLCLLAISVAKAQMTVETYDGVQINDGDILAFNTLNKDTLHYYIHNNSNTDDIRVKIEVVDIVNTDGSQFEFCFGGLCVFNISETTYPITGDPVVIPPGGTNAKGDHFLNKNPGNGTFPLDYVFRFFQVDASGNEIGNSITYTYRYDPNMANSKFDMANMGITLNNTVAEEMLTVSNQNPIQYRFFDLNGKLVQSNSLTSGEHGINVSQLEDGLYLAVFSNEDGRKATTRFIKK